MNQIPSDRLYKLLPAIYQLRDAEEGEPLRALLAVIEQEIQAIEENIGDLYENWFIETCAEWVIPYMGDLLDVRELYTNSFPPNQLQNQLTTTEVELLKSRPSSPRPYGQQERRAYVANTLAYRRRKGTTPVLEQLVQDVTGWRARAVEFSRLLLTTQNLNHLRPISATVDLRAKTALDLIGTPFEQQTAFTAELRRASQDGKYNIPNIGLFVWRLQSYPIQRGTARIMPFGYKDEPVGRFYTFNPLGYDDVPLFNQPQAQRDITTQAQEINLPVILRRSPLADELKDRRRLRLQGQPLKAPRYFNESSPVLQIFINGQPTPIPPEEILICRLALTNEEIDEANSKNQTQQKQRQELIDGKTWYFLNADSNSSEDDSPIPTKVVAIDPELGRIAFLDRTLPARVEVSYLYGFSDDLGGGPYSRGATRSDFLKDSAQKQVEASQESTWIDPLFWEVEQVTSADVNPLETAIQTWNRTVLAWQTLRDGSHIPLARITVLPIQVSQLKSNKVKVRPKFKPGIVGSGLEILTGCCPSEILITPGLAIDRQGRRLEVWQIETFDLNNFDLSVYPNQGGQFILVIFYRADLQGQPYQFALVPETALGDDGYPEGTFIPLARVKVSSDNSDKRFIDQPNLSVRGLLEFHGGIIQGLEVRVRSGALEAVITPGMAVDEKGNVFVAVTSEALNLKAYQGTKVFIAISRTSPNGQQWQVDYISSEVDASSSRYLCLAYLDIPDVKVMVDCTSQIVNGLDVSYEIKDGNKKVNILVSAGEAKDCNNETIQLGAKNFPEDEEQDNSPNDNWLSKYQGQICSLVLCTGVDRNKGQRGNIKIVEPDEVFADFENYILLAKIAVLDGNSSKPQIEIYPAARIIEGLEVSVANNAIVITKGIARNPQGEEIKLEQDDYMFDLSPYAARKLVLFMSRQKRQGLPIEPVSTSNKSDWQQLGIVPLEPTDPDWARTGIILIEDSLRYEGDLEIAIPEGKQLKIVASDGCRPHLYGNLLVLGTAPPEEPNQGELILEGLLIEGQVNILPGNLKRLQINHSTLVPEQGGLQIQDREDLDSCSLSALDEEDVNNFFSIITMTFTLIYSCLNSQTRSIHPPEKQLGQFAQLLMQWINQLCGEVWQNMTASSTQVDSSQVFSIDPCLDELDSSASQSDRQDNDRLEVILYRSISGFLNLSNTVPKLRIEDSIIDKGQPRNYSEETSGLAIWAPGTNTEIFASTIIGMTTVRRLEASNSLFTEKVTAQLNQTGCIRFSHIPEGSQTPSRYQCQPDVAFKEALDPIPDAITSIANQARSGAGNISSDPNDPRQINGETTTFLKDFKVNEAIICEDQTRIIREIVNDNNLIIDQPFEPNLEGKKKYQFFPCLFGSSAGGGVFRSRHNAETWEKTNKGLTNLYVATVFAYVQTGIGKVAIAINETDKTITVRSDSSEFWTTAFTKQLRPKDKLTIEGQTRTVTEILNDGHLTVMLNDEHLTVNGNFGNPSYAFEINTVLVGTTGGKIFRSKNDGDNWVPLTLPKITSTITALCQYDWPFTGTLSEDRRQIEVNCALSEAKFQVGDTITVGETVGKQTLLIANVLGDEQPTQARAKTTTLQLNASIENPSGKTINFHVNTILAATSGDGILRGNANGENWISINQGLINFDIRSLVVNNKGQVFKGQVFAGTAGDGVFQLIHGKSDDKQGDRWIPVNKSLKNYYVSSLIIDKDEKIFTGILGKGVFYLNNKKEWIKIDQGLSSLDITALVSYQITSEISSRGKIITGVNTFFEEEGLRSKDTISINGCKRKIEKIESNNQLILETAFETDSNLGAMYKVYNLLFAATADGKVFRLVNGDLSWKKLNLDLKGLSITTLAVNGSILYLGTAAGDILKSEDAGDSWVSINTGLPNVLEKLLIMDRLQPTFTSSQYGDPGYAQLSNNCAIEILTGAEDGAEVGAFNGLKQPQRMANLQANLEEYLRFGLEAGIFYIT